MYVQGLGVPRNLHTAMAWYKRAEAQHPEHVAELIQHLQLRIDAGDSALDPSSDDVTMPGMVGEAAAGAGAGGAGAGGDALPLSAMTSAGTAAVHLPTTEFVVRLDSKGLGPKN